jgi:hypothetical protein
MDATDPKPIDDDNGNGGERPSLAEHIKILKIPTFQVIVAQGCFGNSKLTSNPPLLVIHGSVLTDWLWCVFSPMGSVEFLDALVRAQLLQQYNGGDHCCGALT